MKQNSEKSGPVWAQKKKDQELQILVAFFENQELMNYHNYFQLLQRNEPYRISTRKA